MKQPQAPSKGPQNAPKEWTTINFSGISLSLPISLKGPTRRSGWSPYAVSYDKQTNDTSFEHRLLLSGIDASTTADGIRQTTNLMSSYLFENYSEIGRVSWAADGDKPATERVAFYWGPATSWLGWTWLLASDVGTGVVTFLSTSLDDGLRNGIENSLTLTRQQQ
ncbi:hypothetical protein [Actinomyces oris]|uniref:hypothetical protein n=1 Tax=Actinomyces oris TaxID=544580 RepID=UPI001F30FE9A|nr:hypothetical protein [Actinomyces oris]